MNSDTRERLERLLRTCYPIGSESEKDAIHRIGRELVSVINALYAAPPPAVPGWVPVEPTEEMLREAAAKVRAFLGTEGPYPRSRAMYRAAIAAAPPYPAVSLPDYAELKAENERLKRSLDRANEYHERLAERLDIRQDPETGVPSDEIDRLQLRLATTRSAVSLPDGWPWDALTRSELARLINARITSTLQWDDASRLPGALGRAAGELARWLEQQQGGRSDG